jgi:flagellar biogenesis protein FliO
VAQSFWAAYLVKLALLGALLAALYGLARLLRESRLVPRGRRRHVQLIESAALSPQAAVHLLRIGTRYLLVGGGNACICKLAEFTPGELEITPQNT